jgi:hypothetical protein
MSFFLIVGNPERIFDLQLRPCTVNLLNIIILHKGSEVKGIKKGIKIFNHTFVDLRA